MGESDAKRSRWSAARAPFWIVAILLGLSLAWFWSLRSDTLYLTAAIWTVGTAWGSATTMWTLYDVTRELRDHRRRQSPDKATTNIGAANVRREILRLIALLALLWIGMSVLTMLSNPLISRVLLIVVTTCLVANSVLDRVERRDTAELLRYRPAHQEPEHP